MHEIVCATAAKRPRTDLTIICEGWADLTRYVAASRSHDQPAKGAPPDRGKSMITRAG